MDGRIETDESPKRDESLRTIGAIVIGVLVATAGGVLCGMAINRFGELGSLSLWGLGVIAGIIARRVMGQPCRGVAWGLVAACIIAAFVAETWWMRYAPILGHTDWQQAIAYWPTFIGRYTTAAVIAALFTGFGATSAFWSVARSGIANSLAAKRILHGLCPNCGYRLHDASDHQACPECGEAIPPAMRSR